MSDSHAAAPDEATTARQVAVHEHISGDAFFFEFVDRFYAGVCRRRAVVADGARGHGAGVLLEYFERAAPAMIDVAW